MKKIFLIIIALMIAITYFGVSGNKVSAEMIQNEEDLYSYYEEFDFVQIKLSYYNSLAMSSEGRIFSWGDNEEGQLGDGTTIQKYMPTEITTNFLLNEGEIIIDLSLGEYHSSVVTNEGRIFIWGDNNSGQLGNGTTVSEYLPIDITSQFTLGVNEKIIDVELGSYYSSVITSEGRIFTWGENDYGQIGDNTTTQNSNPIEITNNFGFNIGEKITKISFSEYHSSAITSEGRIFTWGYNEDGQLGDGTTIDSHIPIEITSNFTLNAGETVTDISLKGSVSSAITNEGRMFTWGYNGQGQLGDGTTVEKSLPVDITNNFSLNLGETITNISLGYNHSSAITSEGRTFTWGYNDKGQLGDGTILEKLLPTEITNQFDLEVEESVGMIELGTHFSSAITSEGRIFTWGENDYGQIGDGTIIEKYVPTEITTNFNALTIIQNNLALTDMITNISLGSHSAVTTLEGRIFTWGSNEVGQLGDGTSIDRYSPIEITNQFALNIGEIITNVSLGYVHSSAITSEGRIFTWGWNGFGRLGDGTTVFKQTPVDITSNFNLNLGETIVSVTLGDSHSLATTSDGRVFTWGCNTYGQLGNGTYDSISHPIPIDITSNFSFPVGYSINQVELGRNHSLLLTSYGKVYTWGANYNGQLGSGTSDSNGHSNPLEITANFNLDVGETITDVSSGDDFLAAITSEGRIFTWGYNDEGQLGDDTTVNKAAPTDITSYFSLNLGEFGIDVSLGDNFSSATTSEGRIFTWGNNNDGQLGNGTTVDSHIPIEITDQFTLNTSETIVQIKLGNRHSSLLTSEGLVFTWGFNGDGQLGDGTTISKSTPTNDIFPKINNILLTYIENNIEATEFLKLSIFLECNLTDSVTFITVNSNLYSISSNNSSNGRMDILILNTWDVGDTVTFTVEFIHFENDEILIPIGNASATTTLTDTTAPSFDSIDDKIIEVGSLNIDWALFILNEVDNSSGTLTKIEVLDSIDYNSLGTYSVTVKLVDELLNETSQTFNVTVVDTTIPVISQVVNQYVNMSQAAYFTTPSAVVTDNYDTDLGATVSYFKANGTIALANLAAAISELELGYDVVIKYNAIDSSSNEAIEVSVTITAIDDIPPVVEGVTDGQIFEKNSEVSITFDEGTATLNGENYLSETLVTEPGDYTLVVTDSYGNITSMTFTLEKASSVLLYVLIGIGVIGLGVGGYFLSKKNFNKIEE